METIKIIIEKSSDSYGAYAVNVNGIYGAGDTVEECKQSILDAIETVKTFEENEIPNILKGQYQIIYNFDLDSLLNYYKGLMSFASLERITGVNQKQLQHYSSGHRKPREAQKLKIQTALHKFGKDLLSVELV